MSCLQDGSAAFDRNLCVVPEASLRMYGDGRGPNDLDLSLDEAPEAEVAPVLCVTAAVSRQPADPKRRAAQNARRNAELASLKRAGASAKKKPGNRKPGVGGGATEQQPKTIQRVGSSRMLDLVEEAQEQHPSFDMGFCFSARCVGGVLGGVLGGCGMQGVRVCGVWGAV